MGNGNNSLKEALQAYRLQFGLIHRVACSAEDNEKYNQLLKEGKTLPEGVHSYGYGSKTKCDLTGEKTYYDFYTICSPDLTEKELNEYLMLKKLNLLTTIKSCLVFFTVLTVISLIVGFFLGIHLI